ncbi:class I SAM-dependent rRNA methyltransferase [Algibacter amylolyticus]|uniref:Class I SAM-dependent rRNA methyltransferase n=1 Tax=Algibacter amylolyticus TaxID=1608400 RepID=A0A5M7B8T8_9FLAO|nr:class I SAM-dependent rRNA methyltransferase [Algibacter amylolyticus]KAA5825782.1 class I SAM-dependent rRNA methyltransferase [Algibacter amylolyticus]MBB5268006.1 23S rRNA (cytosine1962-C5)-methyltransferase [Algibacter amylolyticus]TSJ80080.1 class I SAM-dependent rRNA methyltransferase [Algibacter amylolyticus]
MSFSSKIKSNYIPKRLAVKLNAKGEQFVVQGHPWVFSNNITKINDDAKSGDLAIIFSKNKNRVVGLGLYDANSPIRIKMLHSSYEKAEINAAFFKSKIELAYHKREPLLRTNTNSYRLLFGENDGFPGLIADVYASVLVVKIYSEIWLPYLESIIPSLQQTAQAETVVVRLSRSLEQSKAHTLENGEVVYGVLENEVVEFVEHGVNFSANVIKGHKTGYFLDHRANRKQVGEWSKGKSVLDVFSYAGGFSVHALANGAKEVTSLDISKQALEIAIENGKLNSYSGTHKTIAGDAFAELKQLIKNNVTFDVVVIDPPSFAKQASEIDLAKKKYAQLAELGEQLTAKNGLLVLASCSSRVLADQFFEINHKTLSATKRSYKVVLKTGHDTDHPIGFPEGAYLKCGYYRFKG